MKGCEKSGSLWQYQRDDPYNTTDSESFQLKTIITGKLLSNANTKTVEIAVPLKCLSNLWRTFEILHRLPEMLPEDRKLQVPVVTLSTQ